MYSAIFKVQQNVTTLAFRVGKTEKENIELIHKLNNLTEDNKSRNISNRDTIPETSIIIPDKIHLSFSEILKSNVASEWKTPSQRPKKIETVIKIKDKKIKKT